MKRLITGNTGPNGTLDKDSFAIAVLQYRNTPDPETKLSPAQMLFGHPIRDFIPILPNKYKPHHTWQKTLAAREEALRNRHMKAAERWSEHTRHLPPLKVGDLVRIQNQVGNFPKKWDKTGQVVEVKQHSQYVVKVDGSGRATLRNRRFLRLYTPVMKKKNMPRSLSNDILKSISLNQSNQPLANYHKLPSEDKNSPQSTPVQDAPSSAILPDTMADKTLDPEPSLPNDHSPSQAIIPEVQTPPAPADNEMEPSPAPRRTTRERKQPQRLIESDWAGSIKSSNRD